MNDFVGNNLKNTFCVFVTSCYQVHALNAGAHIPICGAALLL